MFERFGLGPVFVYESLVNARRWQVYATRSFFVLVLLLGMCVVWSNRTSLGGVIVVGGGAQSPTMAQMAKIGESFFYTIAGIQITLVLLVAPAATAGSICMDRARGTLLHMMVTDLSDMEIVFGKLASRLFPVLGMIACSLPVMTLGALLGGIDFQALFGLIGISMSLALLSCTLAMTISVWAKKTHEVLMTVSMIFAAWLLIVPVWWGLSRGGIASPSNWLQKTNPFVLAFSPYSTPGLVGIWDYVLFIGACVATSLLLMIYTLKVLRRAVVSESTRLARKRSKLSRDLRFWGRILPGPSLDQNPVLWREWYRTGHSRLGGMLWSFMFVVTWLLVIWGVISVLGGLDPSGPSGLGFGFLIHIFLGYLMISVTAPTALAEERVRGSLDVMLATPMSSHAIVAGKWWGIYRWVLLLALLPAFVVIFMTFTVRSLPAWVATARLPTGTNYVPIETMDRVLAALLVILEILSSGAILVGVGLLASIWLPRLGRAVGLSVAFFVVIGVGWPILISNFVPLLFDAGFDSQKAMWISTVIQSVSPVVGPIELIEMMSRATMYPRTFFWGAYGILLVGKVLCAIGLYGLALHNFDRVLGRVTGDSKSKTTVRLKHSLAAEVS